MSYPDVKNRTALLNSSPSNINGVFGSYGTKLRLGLVLGLRLALQMNYPFFQHGI